MDLNTLWFILIAVLYIGYFVLEGFDMGVGMLLPFLGKKDEERRQIINTIGPHWDGNEVWLLTAGGATFAAFPHWYATLFSGFYLPLLLMLLALILRGVAFEFRSKDENPLWRRLWDWTICIGSFVPALLWGVAFANFALGVPIDANMEYTGGFFNLLNPIALLAGVTSVLGMLVHGAVFLGLKTDATLTARAQRVAGRLWIPAVLALVVFGAAALFFSPIFARASIVATILLAAAVLAAVAAGLNIQKKRMGTAFLLTSGTILLTVATMFAALFPNVLISSLDPANWSLTIYNASSSPYTLKVMSIVALVFVPVVLAYTAWTYRVFRKRLTGRKEELHY